MLIFRNSNVGVSQMIAVDCDVIEIFINVHSRHRLTSDHFHFLECVPRTILLWKVGATVVLGKTEDASCRSKNMNLH